jgi:hypothetical protein
MPAEIIYTFQIGDWVYYTPNMPNMPDIQDRPSDIGRVITAWPDRYQIEFPYRHDGTLREDGAWSDVIILRRREDGISSLTMLPNNVLVQLPDYPPRE